MKKRPVPESFRITSAEVASALYKYAAEKGVSVGSVLNDALREWLKNRDLLIPIPPGGFATPDALRAALSRLEDEINLGDARRLQEATKTGVEVNKATGSVARHAKKGKH